MKKVFLSFATAEIKLYQELSAFPLKGKMGRQFFTGWI